MSTHNPPWLKRAVATGVALGVNALGVLFLAQLSKSSVSEKPEPIPSSVTYAPPPDTPPPAPEPTQPAQTTTSLEAPAPAAPALTAPKLPSPTSAPMAELPAPTIASLTQPPQAVATRGDGRGTTGQGIFDGTDAQRIKRADEVDTPPVPISSTQPRYPSEAARSGVSGYVQVRVLISERGAVERVDVIEAQPPGVFEAMAREAMQSWRFEPAQDRGRPVRVWVRKRFDFSLGAPSPAKGDAPQQQANP